MKTYIDTQGCSVQELDPSLLQRIANFFRLKPGFKTLQAAEQYAAEAATRLPYLFKRLGMRDMHIVSPFPVQPLPQNTNLELKTAKLNASARAQWYSLRSGIGVNAIKSVKNSKQKAPETFFNVVKLQPEKVREFPAESIDYIKTLFESFLPKITVSDIDGIKAAIKAVELLERSFHDYTEFVAEYDYLKKTSFQNKDRKQELRKHKHEIENYWGAIGRHQFIQFVAMSHAWLISQLTFYSGKSYTELDKKYTEAFDRAALLITQPSFRYNQKIVNKTARFINLISSSKNDACLQFFIDCHIFTGTVSITKSEFKHPSNVREGEYLDIELIGTCSAGLEQISQHQFMRILTEQLPEGTLPQEINIAPEFMVGGGVSQLIRFFKPSYAKKEDYTGKRGWRKQFIRTKEMVDFSSTDSMKTPLFLGINLTSSLQGKATSKVVTNEKIAFDDLTYTRVRFNRFYQNSNEQIPNGLWDAFFAEHKESYKRMFLLINDPNTMISKEISYFFKLLLSKEEDVIKREKLIALRDSFDHAMRYFSLHPEVDYLFEQAKTEFSHFLAELFTPWQKEFQSRCHILSFNKSLQNAQKFLTRIKNRCGLNKGARLNFA